MFEVLKADYDGRKIGRHAHENNIPWQFRHWFTFAIVRNPYDRVVSLWKWYCREEMQGKLHGWDQSLGDFCKWLRIDAKTPQPQEEWLRELPLSLVLKFEDFPGGLAQLPFWKPGTKVPHRHKTKPTVAFDLLAQEAIRDINAWASEDFAAFDYAMVKA